MRRCHFEHLVERALRRIPRRFRDAMTNVAIVIEEWPDPGLAEEVTGDSEAWLYGLFEGIPLPEQGIEDGGQLPPVIHLYRGPLEADFRSMKELADEIELTLVHEIAHFMGLDEEAIRAYGYE